jgi:hypothetical protein
MANEMKEICRFIRIHENSIQEKCHLKRCVACACPHVHVPPSERRFDINDSPLSRRCPALRHRRANPGHHHRRHHRCAGLGWAIRWLCLFSVGFPSRWSGSSGKPPRFARKPKGATAGLGLPHECQEVPINALHVLSIEGILNHSATFRLAAVPRVHSRPLATHKIDRPSKVAFKSHRCFSSSLSSQMIPRPWIGTIMSTYREMHS